MGKQPHELSRLADMSGCLVSQNDPGRGIEAQYNAASSPKSDCPSRRSSGSVRGLPRIGRFHRTSTIIEGCRISQGAGTAPVIAAAVFREHPVQTVRFSDLDPSGFNGIRLG